LQIYLARCAKLEISCQLAASAINWHVAAAKAYRERLEREASQRMVLLKEKDFDAYLKSVQQQSSKHVEELLAETDKCLRGIMGRLNAKSKHSLDGLPGALVHQMVYVYVQSSLAQSAQRPFYT
jgi:hypothetical protein